MRYLMTGLIATLCLALSGCGYNDDPDAQDEQIKCRMVGGASTSTSGAPT